MTRRFLMSSLAVGLVVLGGINAQAGQIPLPSDLGTLETRWQLCHCGQPRVF